MLKHFFTIAFRNLLRNKAFTIINIGGLIIGMTSAILILLWVQNETSFDRFHENSARLYEVYSNDVINNNIRSLTATPEIMAPVLANDVPEIEAASRVSPGNYHILSVGDKTLRPKGYAVDMPFLRMFSFPLQRGDAASALKEPYSVVITEQLAKKLFGNQDAMGKTVKMDNIDNLKVTGVAKDLPNNTQFEFEYLISYENNNIKKYVDSDWTDISISTFVMLRPNASLHSANAKMKNVIVQHSGNRTKTEAFLYPVSALRLYSDFENGIAMGGRIERVRIFLIIAMLIIAIACINFMNLSTARSEKRAREVGVRKVVGARKKYLVLQFLAESVFLAFFAGLLALLVVQLSLPAFNQLVQKQLFVNYDSFYFWLGAAAFILFTGILAGSYPAFFLASFKPVAVLKGSFKKVNSVIAPRKVLVVLQFSIAIGLIICTIIIEQQIQYAQSRKTGYDKNNLVYVFLQGDIPKNYELIKRDLLLSRVATSVTKAQGPLTQNWSSGISLNWQGKDPNAKIQVNRYTEDGGLVKTAGMHLVQGRDIDPVTYASDSTACLISESAVKVMGFKNPIGQQIFDDPFNWHVVGVIQDFILESPYESIKPFMVKGPANGGSVMLLRLNDANSTGHNLSKAEAIFKQYNPAYPFEYSFTDREYAQKFTDEQLTATLARLFAGLTILISCLGLFGLATYMTENRTREIGIRKVLGASVAGIAALISKDFLKLVIIALLIASPLAWVTMSSWLKGYEYRVNISGWVFIIAGGIAMMIALATVSYQALKAGLANPVRALRSE